MLDVPRPDPTKPDDAENAYVFQRSVTFHHADGSTSTGRIDLYKRGCFAYQLFARLKGGKAKVTFYPKDLFTLAAIDDAGRTALTLDLEKVR